MIGAAKLNAQRKHGATEADWITALRRYFCVDTPMGYAPPTLNGQAELIVTNSAVKPANTTLSL